MSASDLFAQLLAVKLEEDRRRAPESDATPNTIGTDAWAPAADAFPRGMWPAGARVYAAVSSADGRRRHRPEALPVITLSPEQRDALTAFRRLGASLSDDFDARQLKAAFRRLALELHPDRHMGADTQRREWLGLRFAVLCEAYRTLSAPVRG